MNVALFELRARTFAVRRALAAVGMVCTAAATTTAAAQTVTVYGLIDVAVEHVGNVGTSGSGLTRMPSATGTLPSRLGFRGSEDLGGGLRAVFVLEQGFAPDVGLAAQGGRGFGRQAFVGLSGRWGALTLGRQYTMLFWSILDADILGTNLYGSGSLDAYLPNARADNAVAYRGSLGSVTVGATFSVGRDSVNAGTPAGTNCAGESSDARACREASVLAKVDLPAWGAAFAVDQIRGGPGALAGLNSSALRDTRVSVNGYANVGTGRVAAGLIRRDNGGSALSPRSDLWFLGGYVAVTQQLRLDGEVFRLVFKGSADRATLVAARATYSLSKRTALYTTVGNIANGGAAALSVSAGAGGSNPRPGGTQRAAAVGLRHAF